MLNSIRDYFNDYTQRLPGYILKGAMKSVGYSFLISSIVSGDTDIGIICGGVAALVSIIDSLAMPFFREMLTNHQRNIPWYNQCVSQLICLSFAEILIKSLTSYRVNLLTMSIFTITTNLFLTGFADQSTYIGKTYYISPISVSF